MDHDVERVVKRAMTVGDLVETMSNYPEHYKVFITSDYGDRGHTEQVHTFGDGDITELDDTTALKATAYSNSGVCLCESEEPIDYEYGAVLIRL